MLIVSQYFWPENFRINDIVSGLKDKGCEITVLTGVPNYPRGKFYTDYNAFNRRIQYYNGIKIIRVPIIPRGRNIFQLVMNYLSFTVNASIRSLFFAPKEFDIIFFCYSPFCEGIPATIINIISQTPIIYWVQDLWPENISNTKSIRNKYVIKLINSVLKKIYKRCEYVLVQSKAYIPLLENKEIGKERIIYLPNSAEDLYKPILSSKYSSLMPDGFKVMFAGNIGPAQDFKNILKAAELVLNSTTNIHWIILGEGRLFQWLKDEITRRNLSKNFHLLGVYPLESMPDFFSLADIMLVSLEDKATFNLTIPGKIQSYLACGKPIVAALNGEGARIIEEAKAGISCSAGDPQQLSRAILNMYNMPETDIVSMGLNGRKYFEANFERSLLINRLKEVLERAVK